MGDFKKEFEKIKTKYYDENPFQVLIEQKDNFSQGPFILYGCGILCRTTISVCEDFAIKITAVCDTYKTGLYADTGLEIISPEGLKADYPNANIFVCSYRYGDDIKKKLVSIGFPEEKIYQATFSMTSFIHPSDFVRDHLAGYEWAYNFFKDDISKKLLLDRIRMYLTGAELKKTSSAPQYFEPGIISLGANEVFVDGGAFTGDTAAEFIKQAEHTGGYRHIYSFEPDDAARKNAIRNLEGYENIDVIGKGLWSCDAELKFFNDGGNASSSFVIGICAISVPVTSIDNLFKDKPDDELPTFIKMDIEGAEKEALAGAKSVIGKKHPKLAICVYHKPEDIYELPKLVYETDPSYQFTLRHYQDGIYETVLYAI